MKSIDVLNAIIKQYNTNPLNYKKIYFTFTTTIELDKSKTLQAKFGVSENNSITFKEIIKTDIDEDRYKEILFSKVIDDIFINIYDRMDSNTFQDTGWSKIIRIDKHENGK